MRGRRLAILLVLLPVYLWLLIVTGFVAFVLLYDPREIDRSFLDDLFGPAFWIDMIEEPEAWAYAIVPALLLAATQIAFVLPAFGPRMRMGRGGGRPLWMTMLAAGLVGGMLTAGLFYACGELLEWWEDGSMWPWGALERGGWDVAWVGGAIFWAQIVAGWLFWTALLWLATRRSDPKRLHNRLVIALLGGTILEALIVVPIDVMVRRRTDCYCSTGTFLALMAAVWAGVWLAGPGVILAVTSKRRRRWGETNCLKCGYAKGPSPGPTCPECGFAWASGRDGETER
jgi:hypothetical protein